jgi:1,4-alpha-glucan branching enzyme
MAPYPRYINAEDLYFFQEGTHSKLSDVMGAHFIAERGGTQFAVWAPHAKSISVIGTFNDWRPDVAYMQRSPAGVWQCFVPGAYTGAHYKFRVENASGYHADKSDPFAVYCEKSPSTASIIWDLNYNWQDAAWMSSRASANSLNSPISIYEVHLGSWRRVPEQGNRSLSYREAAEYLIPYVQEMGFTHVELLPIMEHPFYGSWGYQTTGYFAPTSRYGTPQDFMRLVDLLHQHGIGVILDWVPSHFPQDEYSLGYFDGEHEYEPADPRRGVHPDWNSFIFDYGRPEVRSFLLSSAMFWLDRYHADGLRVDAVASMLYLDYSRKPGQWIPNSAGGRENLDAINFLQHLNTDIYRVHPDTQTIAEESTAWPSVSRPASQGGLGFGMKWDMGWMHDTLQYLSIDPVYRHYQHAELTFRAVYAFNENFILPLSHDEVVYGKGSLLNKMPGDESAKFAGLRLLLSYMYALPGKKLLFMGAEFGQWSEWRHDASLDWHLLQYESHRAIRLLTGDLNRLYRSERALHEDETQSSSFAWINSDDAQHNVLSFVRRGANRADDLLALCNFSSVFLTGYRIGAPMRGSWREIFNSDAKTYSGLGRGNFGLVETVPLPLHGYEQSLTLDLPPLGTVFLKRKGHEAVPPNQSRIR